MKKKACVLINKAGDWERTGDRSPEDPICVCAVSYTHLDVYKRQV